jgi:hypothetical protein
MSDKFLGIWRPDIVPKMNIILSSKFSSSSIIPGGYQRQKAIILFPPIHETIYVHPTPLKYPRTFPSLIV